MPEQVLDQRGYVHDESETYLSSCHHPPSNHLVPLLDGVLARLCLVLLGVGQVFGEESDVSPICCSRILVASDFMTEVEARRGVDLGQFVAEGGSPVDI